MDESVKGISELGQEYEVALATIQGYIAGRGDNVLREMVNALIDCVNDRLRFQHQLYIEDTRELNEHISAMAWLEAVHGGGY